jgi:hypothetical protein
MAGGRETYADRTRSWGVGNSRRRFLLVREKKLLSEEQISTVLDPRVMTGAGQ